jgi:hypothetical protein
LNDDLCDAANVDPPGSVRPARGPLSGRFL